ncbi:AAA family ATPase [Sedimenticola hydrogenitrophicus]|uniref:bifunctional aminoglycoside phosphotransferase/ATP-binding protein n=1 Tax=Sedimenticola hydrogenitrophicus TaxID=2967975 RepID=UPI0021A394EF|nr:bifunctional aminoglycoside phosphotransferase/ATP-binding protein [Sedimenticola hydrogenitrophicus]
MSPSGERHARLIERLRQPGCWPDGIGPDRVIETHISSVLLVGEHAYKIKKPLDLGFLDFSTLARRRHFCEEEIRLNGRLAPDIYLDVIPIGGSPDAPEPFGKGPAIEYAVRMRRFDPEGLLSEHLELISRARVNDLAERLADFHAGIAVVDKAAEYGEPEAVLLPMRENFSQIRGLNHEPAVRDLLARLEHWTETRARQLGPLMCERKAGGFIRECHGDLHLGNIALDGAKGSRKNNSAVPRASLGHSGKARFAGNGGSLAKKRNAGGGVQGRPNTGTYSCASPRLLIFDGIEFNPALRWIDVISELAFLLMDLDEKGLDGYARQLLNRYLELSGDYAALPLLRFYQVYRAMVRAKVTAIRLAQADITSDEQRRLAAEFNNYLQLALRYTEPAQPGLVITHGHSGSGKSTRTLACIERFPAVRVRSDLERRRLAGIAAVGSSGSSPGGGIYTANLSARTYERLGALAGKIMEAGLVAIVDATFLHRADRQRFRRQAGDLGVPFVILDFRLPEATLRQRIELRRKQGDDPSEATLAVLERQLATAEPLTADELKSVVVVESDHLPMDEILARLSLPR